MATNLGYLPLLSFSMVWNDNLGIETDVYWGKKSQNNPGDVFQITFKEIQDGPSFMVKAITCFVLHQKL